MIPLKFRPLYTIILAATSVLLALTVASCQHTPSPSKEATAAVATNQKLHRIIPDIYADPAKALRRLDSLQATLQDTASRLQVEIYKALALNKTGDTINSEQTRNRIIAWCRTHKGHELLEGIVWNHRGVLLSQSGNFCTARQYFERACALISPQVDAETLINVLINAADANAHCGHLVSATTLYRRAHFLADSTGMKQLLPPINAGLGQVYTTLGNYKEANTYLDNAQASIDNEMDNYKYFFYTTRGNCYFFERRYDEALAAFQQALKAAQRIKEAENIALCYANIGETLLAKGDVAQALPAIKHGEDYAKQHPNEDPTTRFYFFSLAFEGAVASNRLDEATRLLREDIDTAGVSNPHYLTLHYYRLRDYAEKQGRYQDAFRFQRQAQRFKDSTITHAVVNNLIEIHTRYERDTTMLHQQVIIADYATQTSQLRLWIIVAVAVIIILGLSLTIYIIIGHRRAERRHSEQVVQMTRLRMEIVQNRMQPHYLFNILGTILPHFRNEPKLSHSIDMLIDMLRSNLLVAGKATISLQEECDNVRKYIDLHHLTHDGWPLVAWHVDPTLPLDTTMPTMSIQIPVENALKHAFPMPRQTDRVDIELRHADGRITLSVTDNGTGYDPGTIQCSGRDTGTGLRVLTRMIEIFNMHNADKAVFTISNRKDGQGTVVALDFAENYAWMF